MSEQADRDTLAEVLAGHETVASGLGEWCCKCDPTTWRPSAQRARHLADAASDLLAQRDRRVAAEALREFADRFRPGDGNPWALHVRSRARRSADRIEAGE